MRKWLFVTVLALAGVASTENRASAWFYWPYGDMVQPHYTPVAFPCLNQPGWYSNSYWFAWYYPWYANYNYSNGQYANWWRGGGFATYGCCPKPAPYASAPGYAAPGNVGAAAGTSPSTTPKKSSPSKKDAKKEPGKVVISLPVDAKLIFNGFAAQGRGAKRTYLTPELDPNQDYEYILTAEVVRDGQTITATERVVVRAGEATEVTLAPSATARGN